MGFLARLRRDQRGTTLAYITLAMVPILGMIGSGVDVGRAYIVKTRMQQACDSGALAARRAMGSTSLDDNDRAEGRRLFFYNFPQNTLGTATMLNQTEGGYSSATNKVTLTTTANGQVSMTATSTVPTIVMGVFGNTDIRVNVSCVGEEYYINNDVMLVLDTTGSMNCAISDPESCGQSTEKSNSKMGEMRAALKSFYTELLPAQNTLKAKNLRLRYGFVPYSSTVNTGKLIWEENHGYLNNITPYVNDSGGWTNVTHSESWFDNDWNGCIEERTTNPYAPSSTSIPALAYDQDIETIPSLPLTKWHPHDPASNRSWNTSTFGDSTSSRKSTFTNGGYEACPKEAKHLTTYDTQALFNTEVDKIVKGEGGTYHDIGMNWGVRMIANDGIFGSKNPNTFNNVKVARTIVFMTDGVIKPNDRIYGAYSSERHAKRVIGTASLTESNLTARHDKRFALMCARAKSMNIDVWVIAISTTLTTSLTNCAPAGQAQLVTNTAQLTDVFKRIANKVGNLRIGE
jgi:Flp pilus assembly protein TadG